MFEKIAFYNHFHNGDLHVSREFVKEIINNVLAKRIAYFIDKSVCGSRVLFDIPCEIDDITKINHSMNEGISIVDNILYINTWYASNNFKYYLDTTIQSLYNYFSADIHDIHPLKFDILHYIPQINYSKLEDYQKISNFANSNKNKTLILICDNLTLSGQGILSDDNLNSLVNIINSTVVNPLILSTNKVIKRVENVMYVDEIFTNKTNNLPEISFLSTFCKYLIGQISGPHTMCYVKENILNPKKFICFSSTFRYDFGLTDLKVPCVFKNYKNFNTFKSLDD